MNYKNMKKLFIIGLLAVSTLIANAQWNSTSVTVPGGPSTNTVLTSAAIVTGITLLSTDTNVMTFTFHDCDTAVATNMEYVTAAWTNFTWTLGYTTNTWINDRGVTNVTIRYGMNAAANPHAAATNTYPALLSVAVPAGGTWSTPSTFSLLLSRGLTYTCSATNTNTIATMTINYR